jgi:hypothetical protein
MNNLLKAGVAGALALGYVSAHAGAVIPSSYNTGDVFLFADVISGGSVIKAFAADTTVTVDNATGGTAFGTLYATTGNLSALLTAAQATGATLQWTVMGGGGDTNGDLGLTFVTTDTNSSLGTLTGRSGVNLSHWLTGFVNTATLVNTNTGANPDVLASSAAGAGGWDPTILTANASNWYSNGPTNLVTGLGSATLYEAHAVGQNSTLLATVTNIGTVTLSASGLTFTAPAPVPLPAAIWLLGSGLLGLAGVGRRKLAAA